MTNSYSSILHIHRLDGCAPVPLAHYLKALGILRLITEQADPHARGWWEGERFHLMSTLDRAALDNFFLNEYAPTSLVSPWNKGSGFFLPQDPGLTPVEKSTAPRFENLRKGITASRELLSELEEADKIVRGMKAETKNKALTTAEKNKLKDSPAYTKRLAEAARKFKALKSDMLPRIRLSWRGTHREWLDAAMVLLEDGTPKYPSLLGTGGNDGRLDFTNNFFQRLNEAFDMHTGRARKDAFSWFAGALWNECILGCQTNKAIGQYLPGMVGGANSSNGPNADSLLNPADFILMLEGAVLFTASVTRRLGVNKGNNRVAAPFTVSAQGAGYASAAGNDESARGEQWMPLWPQPMLLEELRHLMAEGRAQIGAKAVSAPLDLARAVARLGTARGISAFQRYGYIERNGQSNMAVPLGRFLVPAQILPLTACLDDLDAWLPRLHRDARDSKASQRLKLAEHRLSEAIFAVLQYPEIPTAWQAALLALANVEALFIHGTENRCGPLPRLRPDWVQAVDDGSPEIRLAVSFALQAGGFRQDGSPVNTVRRHWFAEKNQEYAVVLSGRNGRDDAIALIGRRLIEASQKGRRDLPLKAARLASASLSDLAALVAGEIDLDRTLALARAFMAIDGKAWAMKPYAFSQAGPAENRWPDDAWLVIRLAMLPWPLADGREVKVDPAIFHRLANGDAASAFLLARRRLQAAGIRPSVRLGLASALTAQLWAAALAFPIHRGTATAIVRRLDPQSITP